MKKTPRDGIRIGDLEGPTSLNCNLRGQTAKIYKKISKYHFFNLLAQVKKNSAEFGRCGVGVHIGPLSPLAWSLLCAIIMDLFSGI